MKKLIQKFNSPQTHLVISDWPEKTQAGEKNYGIAWYTKELLESLAKTYNLNFVVLAERGKDNKPRLFANGHILVLRIFDQKHPALFPRILKWLLIFNRINNIDVHSEFCTNGGIKNFMLLLPFITLIKAKGKHITYFSHNVVTDLNSIAPHLGFKRKSLAVKTLNLGLQVFYKILGLIVDRFVVMDEVIFHRLAIFVNPQKIFLLPFWVENQKSLVQTRKGEFKLLYFGFITHYKGADWIIGAIKELRKQKKFANIRLVLAGGKAYSLKDKRHYQSFYKKILESVAGERKITITGFVPEKEIASYFAASDLVVLPYRGFIGSSGVLAWAVSCRKPFILSSGLAQILRNKDLKACLIKEGVKPTDLVFNYNAKSLGQVIEGAQKPGMLNKLRNLSVSLGKEHSKAKLLESCYNNLYVENKKQESFSIPSHPRWDLSPDLA